MFCGFIQLEIYIKYKHTKNVYFLCHRQAGIKYYLIVVYIILLDITSVFTRLFT